MERYGTPCLMAFLNRHQKIWKMPQGGYWLKSPGQSGSARLTGRCLDGLHESFGNLYPSDS